MFSRSTSTGIPPSPPCHNDGSAAQRRSGGSTFMHKPVERDPLFAGLQAAFCILFLPVLMALAAVRDGCRALLHGAGIPTARAVCSFPPGRALLSRWPFMKHQNPERSRSRPRRTSSRAMAEKVSRRLTHGVSGSRAQEPNPQNRPVSLLKPLNATLEASFGPARTCRRLSLANEKGPRPACSMSAATTHFPSHASGVASVQQRKQIAGQPRRRGSLTLPYVNCPWYDRHTGLEMICPHGRDNS